MWILVQYANQSWFDETSRTQLSRLIFQSSQCYMGNSCNHEHEEEIEEDIICCTRRRGRYLPKYMLGRVSVITVISSYLDFKGYSAVPDWTVRYRIWFVGHKSLKSRGKKSTQHHTSLRVAVPSPRGKTGGRERLRKADTNRVMWRQGNLCKYVNKLYFPRKNVCTRAVLTQTN